MLGSASTRKRHDSAAGVSLFLPLTQATYSPYTPHVSFRPSKLLFALAAAAALATTGHKLVERVVAPSSSAIGYELSELAKGMNVVLVVFDTTPGKSLDLLDPKSAPVLSRYAKEGVVFTKAYAAAPWTRPAVASILTGYHPKVHGVREFTSWYNPGVVTLGQMLSLHGYETVGFVSHWLLSQDTTFKQGFSRLELIDGGTQSHDIISAPAVAQSAVSFILDRAPRDSSEHFFLLAHFFDPHFSYLHHPDLDRSSWYKGPLRDTTPFAEIDSSYQTYQENEFSFLRDLHLEEVSFTELHVDHVFQAIKASPYADNTIVIVVADHGEEFHEHGAMWHGHSMYDEVIRVPLMIWAPKKLKPAVVTRWVSAMDIVPTLVDVKETVSSRKFFGESLFSGPSGRPRWLYAEVGDNSENPVRNLDAILQEPLKFIVNRNEKWEGLFNLSADPEERTNLAAEAPLVAPFRAELDASIRELAHFLPHNGGSAPLLSSNQVQELRSLGYLSEAKVSGDLDPAPQ